MEVQPTDFENAAFAVFVVLLSRAILNYNMNLYIPISNVRPMNSVSHAMNTALYTIGG